MAVSSYTTDRHNSPWEFKVYGNEQVDDPTLINMGGARSKVIYNYNPVITSVQYWVIVSSTTLECQQRP